MKPLRLLVILSLVVCLFSLPHPISLVKISKGAPQLVEILKAHQTEVLQELATCYLAKADCDEVAFLRKCGISVSVLDRDSEGKEYVLVSLDSPAGLKAVSALGRILAIEGNLHLFWTDAGDPTAWLPPGIKRKPLPLSSILPFLRTASRPEGLTLELKVNDVIRAIISELSRDNLRTGVQSLEAFQTRYTTTPNCEAAGQFILDYFQSLGLEAGFEPFTFGAGTSTRNVVAEIKGRTDPEEIVIICAHYDSDSWEPAVYAPGADDNASGVAAVMEAARILVGYPLDFTVRFVAFSAEEWGLYGSRYHADRCRENSERIIGVVNLDMIAYAESPSEDLDIVVNEVSRWLAERTAQIASLYTGLEIRKTVDPSFINSDHSPFWDLGYFAFCAIEDADVENPFYHTPYDTVDTLNFDFFEDAARTVLAALSDLAQPVRPGYPKTPAGLAAETAAFASAFTAVKNVRLTWQPVDGAAGYYIYRSAFPHFGYAKINDSPPSATVFVDRALQADTSYYYVVTAVSPQGLESNFSREAESPAELPRYGQAESGEEASPLFWRWP